jgi:hypothetical protein
LFHAGAGEDKASELEKKIVKLAGFFGATAAGARLRGAHSGWEIYRRCRDRRLLDDHLHDPPDPIYDLLGELAERCPNPLTMILEHDGSLSADGPFARAAQSRAACIGERI